MTSHSLSVEIMKTNVKKIVVVVGSTGTGKSTIINMLYNNDYTKDACLAPCDTNSTADSVTKKTRWLISPKSGFVFGDTVGLGDPSQNDLQVVYNIKSFIRRFDGGVHTIILVARFGRWSAQDRANISAISEIFNSNCYNACILVLSFYDGKKDEASMQASIRQWAGEDIFVEEFLKKINNRVILTNNSVEDDDYEKITRNLRRLCVQNLMSFIDSSQGVVGPKPRNFIEAVKALLDLYFGYYRLVNAKKRIENAKNFLLSSAKDVYAAECPICQDDVALSDLAQTAECYHFYHLNCIKEYAKTHDGKVSCPICRRTILTIYITQSIPLSQDTSIL